MRTDIFYHHTNGEGFNFLSDLLPVLISSLALLLSVIMPFLLIRYEKIFTRNKQHKEFLLKIELFLLEWLNTTASNQRVIKEFIDTLKHPKGVFPKDFNFYEFPPIEFLDTYNTPLLNESYVVVRKLKGLNKALKEISAEYKNHRYNMISKEDGIKITNSKEFFIESLEHVEDAGTKAILDLTKIKASVFLLLEEADSINSLTFDKFFSFNPKNTTWYKKDLDFTAEDLKRAEDYVASTYKDGSKDKEKKD